MPKQEQGSTTNTTGRRSKAKEESVLKKSTAVDKSEPRRGDYHFLYWDQWKNNKTLSSLTKL